MSIPPIIPQTEMKLLASMTKSLSTETAKASTSNLKDFAGALTQENMASALQRMEDLLQRLQSMVTSPFISSWEQFFTMLTSETAASNAALTAAYFEVIMNVEAWKNLAAVINGMNAGLIQLANNYNNFITKIERLNAVTKEVNFDALEKLLIALGLIKEGPTGTVTSGGLGGGPAPLSSSPRLGG